MKLLYAFLLVVVMIGCTKTVKNESSDVICILPVEPAWLSKLKADYASCSCLTAFYKGIYKNQPVVEVKGMDPLCNGINIVYKMDGSIWFSSAEDGIYQDYRTTVQHYAMFWSCSEK